MATPAHPFAFAEPGYVPLARSPLVRTLAQIRFPQPTAFVADQDAVAVRVAKQLADVYPLFESGQEAQLTITPDGVTQQQSATRLWRLANADRSWQVTFGPNFLAIETSTYVRRSDFATRLGAAWFALRSLVNVPHISRLGVRYINQVSDRVILERLPDLVRPEVLGVSGLRDETFEVLSALTEAQYRFVDGAGFTARWGFLPPQQNLGVDIPGFNHSTWVLDTDSFREWAPGAFAENDLEGEVKNLGLRGYQFFRWAVTDEALRTFGAEL